MIIKEIKQDLFELDEKYALAHCISLDCVMGAGIAKEFNRRYPEMKQGMINYIKRKNLNYPIAICYTCYSQNNRPIFNLISKEKYYQKPTYEILKTCVESMARMCNRIRIKHLAMPLIGCGLDRLKWDKVKPIIEEAFKDNDIEILVCKL